MAGVAKDRRGQQFGNILVLEDTGRRTSGGNVIWLCQCSCGRFMDVQSAHLISGNTTSCGIGKCHHKWVKNRTARNDYCLQHVRNTRSWGKPTNCELCSSNENVNYAYIHQPGGYSSNRSDYMMLCKKHHAQSDAAKRRALKELSTV